MEDHILRDRNQNQLSKATDQVKSNVEMDQHQEIYEKENYNPKSLKEILTGSQKDSSKTEPLPVQDVNDCNDTFTHETEAVKSCDNTFDQTSDDESYISTNESLGFLADGFNNMQLESEGRRSLARSPIVNSTMHADSQPLFEPSVNITLTIESPPISECSQKSNTTLTGDKTQDIEVVQSPQPSQQNENYSDITEGIFPDTVCEYIQKVDTIDEIAAALACPDVEEKTYNTEDLDHNSMTPISPIYPPAEEPSSGYVSANEMPSMNVHEANITSSAAVENSSLPAVDDKPEEIEINSIQANLSIPLPPENPQEINLSMPQLADTSTASVTTENYREICEDDLSIHVSPENDENNSTVTINQECLGNSTMPIPMEIDQTMGVEDITSTQEQDVVTVDPLEVEKSFEKPQKVFECDFVSQSVQQLQFEFKTPEMTQKGEPDDLHKTLEMESPPNADLHQSSEAEKSQEDFKVPSMPKRQSVERFESAATYNFGNFDFDVLQKCGSNSPADFSIARDSVLLRFDPLLEKIAPVETINQRLTPTAISTTRLASTKEEEELYLEGQSWSDKQPEDTLIPVESFTSPTNCISSLYTSPPSLSSNAEISAMKDLDQGNETIESVHEAKDQFKDISDNNQQLLQQQEIEFKRKMTELESQLRKEAEIKEEALLKRITEKEKQMAKMSNVVEAYEKTIATLIAEKEQLIQSYEKKCLEIKNDSEQNYHHLASLESTFSDLHAKYERTKQLAFELKTNEETSIQERKSLQESLKLQEARYEKMKMHAMSQLEIANNKLAEMQRNHQADTTKLKAQLKKEEISRASINEQLIQKSKENAELVKICDELIGNHGHSQNA